MIAASNSTVRSVTSLANITWTRMDAVTTSAMASTTTVNVDADLFPDNL